MCARDKTGISESVLEDGGKGRSRVEQKGAQELGVDWEQE